MQKSPLKNRTGLLDTYDIGSLRSLRSNIIWTDSCGRLPSPQLSANLLVAHGCGLTSVRGNRGENYIKESLVHQKHKKKKKLMDC
jgi:hypothetical protein